MQIKELNSGVIFTKPNCIGCNKCISGCPVVGANVVITDTNTGRQIVSVNPNKCILCGTCVDACVHYARTYNDDTDAFFEALERGEEISILVAPTLLTDYEKQYHNILGYLKESGVQHIYNTGFGADLMVWVHMNFILEFGLAGVISQFCPVIVNYLEKYRPELLQYLLPVQSPVMCTAIYVHDYLKVPDKLAYISPCIAGKYEIDDVNTYGMVTYNVTFERLMKRISKVDISNCFAEDEVGYGLGALISTAGGLSENIQQYIGFSEVLIQTSGPTNIFPYFDHYYKEVNENGELPFLVDALSCTDGCNFGTGTNCGYEMRNEMSFSAHRAREKAFQSGKVFTARSYEERLTKLNQRFESFALSSFVRQYDNTRNLPMIEISENQIQEIFQSMYKHTMEQQHMDCGSCGYKSCRNMAYAIGTKVNYKENCITYSKECIRRETEKTNHLLEEISKMNEELKRSTQLKSNFLANMSHEIRTPMNAIIGMAEMALRGDLDDEERGYIQQIKSSGRSLLAIINDILDFSKIESGKMEINETEYAVMSIINDTVNMVMTRIREKDISLLVNADPTIPFKLYGDDIRIKQVLVNLANNAVKFTQKGFVEITLSHERCEEGVRLKVDVRDTGMGIKPEERDKLFTSFQQIDSKRNRNIEGTGLGLAISREFVNLMDGGIKVESVYGEGSTFSFWVPQKIVEDVPSVRVKEVGVFKTASLIRNEYVRKGFDNAIAPFHVSNIKCSTIQDFCQAIDEGAKFLFIEHCFWDSGYDAFAKSHPEIQIVVIVDPRRDIVSSDCVRKLNLPVYCLNIAAILNQESEGMYDHDSHTEQIRFEAPNANVLIVDDNAINLTVAKGLLSPIHMNISVASSGPQAIEMIDNNQYDIVFMDHMMPDMDGVEATHLIREKVGDYYKNLPIIALTANAINNAKEMFLREGMNDFVAKPIDMLDITSKLRRWLPPEKIKNMGGSKEEAGAAVPEELLQIEGIDVASGVALSGSLELYKTILADYYEAIEKKAALIEAYEAEDKLESYTIEVHALKSASRLIGANELSEMAAFLEKCGNEKDADAIHEKTEELIRLYRSYIPILSPYKRSEDDVEKAEIPLEQLKEKLTALCEALDDFDIDAAKSIMEDLKSGLFDDMGQDCCERLAEGVQAMEYDDAIEIASEWIEKL